LSGSRRRIIRPCGDRRAFPGGCVRVAACERRNVMTGNTIPPPGLDLLARRANVERETADSAKAQALMDPIFPAMARSGYLDSLGLVWGRSMSCWRIIWSPFSALPAIRSASSSVLPSCLPSTPTGGRCWTRSPRRRAPMPISPPPWPDLGSGAARVGRHHRLRLRPPTSSNRIEAAEMRGRREASRSARRRPRRRRTAANGSGLAPNVQDKSSSNSGRRPVP
jgi:hypothetical protein